MFAVLHIVDFALHAILRTTPAGGNRPAALFASTTKKSLVLAANDAARAAGVELGMTAPQAVARCVPLFICTPKPEAEAEARATLLAIGFTLSPAIEDTAPGVCTIDVKGVDPAKLTSTVHAAVGELVRLGLPATGGIACTPLLALHAARAANRAHSPSSFSSPPASTDELKLERTRPKNENEERLPVLHVTSAASFLAPLPLAVADPTPELADILARWGLRTLGEFTALPRDEIVRRFGAAGLAFWQRASGGAPRPLHPVSPARTFSARLAFELEIETLEPLLFILRRFLDRLTLELRAAQYVAATLSLTIHLGDGTVHARDFRLPEPTADTGILFRTLHTHLESLHTAAPISAVQLRITPARPLVRQQDLFEAGLRDPHGFAETLARVVAIVGSDRVGTPQVEETHRPEAVKLVPPVAVIPPPGAPAVHPPLGLPLRRFRPPLPVKLELTDRQPAYVWTADFHGAIAEVYGPWRGSGDWWQPDRAWERMEYDIALVNGGLYRLLLTDGAWFVEGEYD